MPANRSPLAHFALLAGLLWIFSCKSTDCDKSIIDVLPGTNPPGYEVILKTNDFNQDATVRFGDETAVSRPGEANEIIARVPAGLAGNVQVTLEEGKCIARFDDFIVSGSLPSNLQTSLPDIVIPTTPATYPSNFTNAWFNAADANRLTGIQLTDDGSGTGNLDPSTSNEFHFGGDDFFNGNPVSGSIKISTNTIYLEIDRTAKGGTVEKFDGQFISPAGIPDAQHAILLTSRQTGRQLVLIYL